MKRIAILFGHLASSDGISRSAIAIANLIVSNRDYDVTLIPLFNVERDACNVIDKQVHIKKIFGFYFHGLAKIISLFPSRWLYSMFVGNNQYDLVIGFNSGVPTRIVGGRGVKTTSKRIIWMHGFDTNLVYKKEYLRVGYVVNVSRNNAVLLKNKLGNSLGVSNYCYNPIDDSQIIKEGSLPIDIPYGKELLFVSVGRHSPEKGYLRLITIVHRLVEEGFTFKLWLVGDGPEHKALIEKSKILKLDNIICFTGATTNPHKYTAKADVFICSSFSEGYSTACTESLILGVPIITTSVGGSQEQIDDAECGIRCGLSDEDLYNSIKTVLLNPKLVSDWKMKLKKTSIRFSQSKRSAQLFSIIDTMLQ